MENVSDEMSLNERSMLAAVMRMMAAHNLIDIFSLKIISAVRDVATISELLMRDTDSALEFLSAFMSSTGAAISNTTIRIRYGKSLCVNDDSQVSLFFRKNETMLIPVAAPRYRRPAINAGGILSNSIFEKGVLIA